MPVATRLTDLELASASAIPNTMIDAVISRRTSRRRVSATGDSAARRPRSAIRCARRLSSSGRRSRRARTRASTVTTAVDLVAVLRDERRRHGKIGAGMTHEATQARRRRRPSAAARRARARARVGADGLARLRLVAAGDRRGRGLRRAVGAGGRLERNAEQVRPPALTRRSAASATSSSAPLARWDAVWFLAIANARLRGGRLAAHAFFPLYPLLSRGLAELGGGSAGALLIAAYAVSLAAFFAALVLLYRLAALELGRRAAGPTVLLLCVFPASLFFGAPYSESLFLLCSVGAFYAARTGSWAWAGVARRRASATRSAGCCCCCRSRCMYLYGPRADAAAPAAEAGSGARAAYRLRPTRCGWRSRRSGSSSTRPISGSPTATRCRSRTSRSSGTATSPGRWSAPGTARRAAFDGARQLLSGSRDDGLLRAVGGRSVPRRGARTSMLFGFLCFALVAALGVLRRLPFAYGALRRHRADAAALLPGRRRSR